MSYVSIMTRIILASGSKYRKELLERLGIDFECISPNIDEDKLKDTIKDPVELSKELSRLKAQEIFKDNQDALVIGSDQVCFYQGKILGKSGSIEKSYQTLSTLSGNEHILATAYTIMYEDQVLTNVNTTKLKMKKFDGEFIKKYLSLDNPIDCAGSYKLELYGIALFSKIETTDHTAIIGLPLIELSLDLEKLGISLLSKG